MTSIAPQKDASHQHSNGKKLLLYVTIMVCILTAAAVSIIQLNNIVIGGPSYTVIKKSTDAIENVALINSDLHQIINEVRPIMHDADKGAAITMARLLAIDIDKKFANLHELVKTPGRRESVIKADATWKEYKKTLLEEIVPAAGKGDKLKIAYLTTGIQAQRYNSLNKNMTTLTTNLRQDIAALEQQASSDKTIRIAAMTLLTSVVLALIVYFSQLIFKNFNKSLQPAIKHARDAAGGHLDLTLPAEGAGKTAELHDSINLMTGRFRQTVSDISAISSEISNICEHLQIETSVNQGCTAQKEQAAQELGCYTDARIKPAEILDTTLNNLSSSTSDNALAAAELLSACNEIAPKTELIESRAQQINSSISAIDSSSNLINQAVSDMQQIAAGTSVSVLQLNDTIRQVETSAFNTSIITDALMLDAENSRQAAEAAISAITAIRSSSRLALEAIESLSARAKEIDSIVSTVDEIAEQTGLLALNANIIASQAGEHGGDFAVVAGDINALSERSSSFSSEISAVARGIRQESQNASDTFALTETDIENGELLARHALMSLNQIVSSIQQAGIQVREIAQTTTGQTQKGQTFKDSIESLSTLAEQTVRMSSEQIINCRSVSTFNGEMLELAAELRSLSFKHDSTAKTISRLSLEIGKLVETVRETEEDYKKCCDDRARDFQPIEAASTSSPVIALENSIQELKCQISMLENELSIYKF